MSVVILIAFLVLLAGGVPIAFAMGGAGLIGLLLHPDGFLLLPALTEQIFNQLNSFPFLTIPLFIFAGTIMSEGGIAGRLMDVANMTIGRGRGGLGSAIVVAALFFHGISGSSSADTAAIGKVTLPGLRRQGYPAGFAAALLAAAGATSTLIPPSTDFILIGVVANMSIAGLFAAGLIPACINALGLILLVIYSARKNGFGKVEEPFDLKAVSWAEFKAVPGLFMIVIILGGILGGVFTPTEASAVAVVYGILLTAFVYRSLTVEGLVTMFIETIEIAGMVLTVIAMSAILSYTLTIYQVPTALAAGLDAITTNKILFLLLVQILFFVIGTLVDTTPAILILMPILTPMAVARGVEPIHFGILVEVNIALGMAHPPAGNCLFTACAITKVPLEHVIRPLLPFIGVLIVTMMVITYVEDFSMFLPRLLGVAK
jgi:tripartite ATP-independent transporter DctM subunit